MANVFLFTDTLLALLALLGVLRLAQAQRQHQREIQTRVATLARVVERAGRARSTISGDLSPAETQALADLKRREARRARRAERRPDDAVGESGS